VQLPPDDFLHLTYCTNIHAADGWPAVRDTLARVAPALKARLAPSKPFGLGLRLSAREARELASGPLDAFRTWLDAEGLYVALINGFPYGPFHRSVVKAEVYAPDWRDDARVAYTLDLVEILRRLAPEGLDAGVSTAPLSYKAWMSVDDESSWKTVTANVVRVVERLAAIRRDEGTLIHLDIEPEPDCVLETTDETIDFFERWLLPVGAPLLAASTGGTLDDARRDLLDHVRVCFDCCHFAVEHEDPIAAIDRLRTAGIGIGRVQLSSALTAHVPDDARGQAAAVARLRPFDDATYLHQVMRRGPSGVERFPDLGPALEHPAAGDWRIHFHVPLFTRDYDGLASTQSDVARVIAAAEASRFTRHLEIETYTWDVLPGALKLDVVESIAREYDWVLRQTSTGRDRPIHTR
jgi:sugar phosphate isomerase/epimerase